jgi:hypothetical protein
VSNAALSFGEDVAAIGLTWLATKHPIAATIIVAICLVLVILAVRFVIRSVQRLFQQVRSSLHPNPQSLTR